MFAYAHALGKEFPDEGWGAMLGNMEPAQLRTYLGTMMRMGKAAAAEEFPPAADWIEAYASYLESGGAFEFASNPPTPITKALIDDGRNNQVLTGDLALGMPVRILQGMEDPDVPYTHALHLVECLAHDDVQITLIKDGDHRLSRDEDIALLRRTMSQMVAEY